MGIAVLRIVRMTPIGRRAIDAVGLTEFLGVDGDGAEWPRVGSGG